MMQDSVTKLQGRIPPEEIKYAMEELQNGFAEEKNALEKKMEEEIESVRN